MNRFFFLSTSFGSSKRMRKRNNHLLSSKNFFMISSEVECFSKCMINITRVFLHFLFSRNQVTFFSHAKCMSWLNRFWIFLASQFSCFSLLYFRSLLQLSCTVSARADSMSMSCTLINTLWDFNNYNKHNSFEMNTKLLTII